MRSTLRIGASVCLLAMLAACGGKNDRPTIDYRTPGAKPEDASARLEVPPDLTAPTRDERYLLTTPAVTATAESAAVVKQPVEGQVVPQVAKQEAPSGIRMQRAGTQRWLVLPNARIDQTWPKLLAFWKANGFIVLQENAAVGVMMTDWAENRAKLYQDPIQNALGRVLGSLISTGERDRFRLRVERIEPGQLEIYISHQRLEEVAKGDFVDGTIWMPRPADVELEAEMLQRLVVYLGVESQTAQQIVAESKAPLSAQAELITATNGRQQLRVKQPLDRAWRQLGLALDRVGVVVEDRDRTKNLYSVRHLAAEQENKEKEGFWSKLAFWRSKPALGTSQYQVKIEARGEQESLISLLDKDGAPAPAEATKQILGLLLDQLK
ncbi:MAG: hypothetical protein CGU28_17090 [Candidatus Dactylopiibacterium carminicum]|nr:MAG: hypothetical protein CGU28_17090 [Candidatus Dactylopiibacterium carminicum]